jgi:hypothetical protein
VRPLRRGEAIASGGARAVVRGAVRCDWAAAVAALGRTGEAHAALVAADAELRAIGDEALRVAVEIHRGHLELARSRVAAANGDATLATALHRAARDLLALAPMQERPSDDVRFASRLLERAIASDAGGGGATVVADPSVLTVGAEGGWFVPPGATEPVDLSRRSTRRLLGALAHHRLAAPGRARAEALFQRAGRERIVARRARVAFVALTSPAQQRPA